MTFVLRVVVQCLEAEIFAIVDDICVFADDDSLTCLKLIDGDLIVIEKILLILLQFQQVLRVRGCYILYVLRVCMLYPRRHIFLIDEVHVIKVGNIFEGLVYGTFELRRNALFYRAF